MTDNIEFMWDKLLNDDSLTTRIYRNGEFLGRGFTQDNDTLNMQLSWTNAQGFLDRIIDKVTENMSNARNDATTLNNLIGTLTGGKAGNTLQTELQTEISASELYKSFKGYSFNVNPSVNVYFISDSRDSNAIGKCKTFLENFLPQKTNKGNSNNTLWFVTSNTKAQKINFGSEGISVDNGFTLVVGGNNTNNSEGKLVSEVSGNGQRVYSNLVVEGINVQKSVTTVKLDSGFAPLFLKVEIQFTPIATLAPNAFRDMI